MRNHIMTCTNKAAPKPKVLRQLDDIYGRTLLRLVAHNESKYVVDGEWLMHSFTFTLFSKANACYDRERTCMLGTRFLKSVLPEVVKSHSIKKHQRLEKEKDEQANRQHTARVVK